MLCYAIGDTEPCVGEGFGIQLEVHDRDARRGVMFLGWRPLFVMKSRRLPASDCRPTSISGWARPAGKANQRDFIWRTRSRPAHPGQHLALEHGQRYRAIRPRIRRIAQIIPGQPDVPLWYPDMFAVQLAPRRKDGDKRLLVDLIGPIDLSPMIGVDLFPPLVRLGVLAPLLLGFPFRLCPRRIDLDNVPFHPEDTFTHRLARVRGRCRDDDVSPSDSPFRGGRTSRPVELSRGDMESKRERGDEDEIARMRQGGEHREPGTHSDL